MDDSSSGWCFLKNNFFASFVLIILTAALLFHITALAAKLYMKARFRDCNHTLSTPPSFSYSYFPLSISHQVLAIGRHNLCSCRASDSIVLMFLDYVTRRVIKLKSLAKRFHRNLYLDILDLPYHPWIEFTLGLPHVVFKRIRKCFAKKILFTNDAWSTTFHTRCKACIELATRRQSNASQNVETVKLTISERESISSVQAMQYLNQIEDSVNTFYDAYYALCQRCQRGRMCFPTLKQFFNEISGVYFPVFRLATNRYAPHFWCVRCLDQTEAFRAMLIAEGKSFLRRVETQTDLINFIDYFEDHSCHLTSAIEYCSDCIHPYEPGKAKWIIFVIIPDFIVNFINFCRY